ncbi:isochorismatase family protein [Rubinisphaera margarita]|uniref:isochorismatase family protein n=1 Tax=Rubinisphaera margarita TaxID=2909586 RepID=UPI001EE894AA|nr:isochorismatase family protein [Rubinisphaera margarita]MCG6155504.1 isochorismatase family protein [Rubinisphaera margarita]
MPEYLRSPQLARASECLVIAVDLQEKLLAGMSDREDLLARCRLLLRGARELEIPVLATEQYPQGLGSTEPSIAELIPHAAAKKRFSSVETLDLPCAGERDDDRFRVIVLGIEAHVCILQTVFDLQSLGYEILIPVDAVTSRNAIDRQTALQRMQSMGVTLTTVETLLFECCETAEHPRFKTVSRMITGRE